jgi:hypothetical protein
MHSVSRVDARPQPWCMGLGGTVSGHQVMDLRGGCTRWQMVANQCTLPQCWEGRISRISAWCLRATIWPDRAPEVTMKLAEAGVVGGGRLRCLAEVSMR